MKKEINEVIRFDHPSDIIYWSKKWEISPIKLYSTFEKIKSNNTNDIKAYLRNDGFAL